MYNLGAQRTLTLVNGNRFVSSASSSLFGPVAGSPVDFSTLPVNLVERVETVSVGGAPIYGSDAIAGTVNVILKRNYQGLSFAGQSGISERGRGGTYNVSGLVGQNFAEERGNITLSLQYDKQNGIPTSEIFYQSGDAPFFTRAQPGKPFQQQLYYGGQRYAVFRPAVLRDHRCERSRTLLRGERVADALQQWRNHRTEPDPGGR
jgi:outer membrane receptor protein involved in Fe transport